MFGSSSEPRGFPAWPGELQTSPAAGQVVAGQWPGLVVLWRMQGFHTLHRAGCPQHPTWGRGALGIGVNCRQGN